MNNCMTSKNVKIVKMTGGCSTSLRLFIIQEKGKTMKR